MKISPFSIQLSIFALVSASNFFFHGVDAACSGYFCDGNKRLNDLFITGTHNSLAVPGRTLSPNQNFGIKTQYEDGIRLFNFDLYMSNENAVVTHHGDIPGFSYHPRDEVEELANLVRSDPNEFVVIQLQDSMTPAGRDSFLSWLGGDLVVTNFDINEPLASYINQGQQVLILTDRSSNINKSLGMHDTAEIIGENDYSWKSCYFGSAPTTPRHGRSHGPVKLMNYFCSPVGAGDIIASDSVNQKHRILYSAREFVDQFNGINMVLVDYYDEGDVFAAQSEIRDGDLHDGCWGDQTLCGEGTTCWKCCSSSSYWYSKAFTACGQEPKWEDGKACALGTTCNACQNPATYWWGKAFTACGSEPRWADGTRCLAGTSCRACQNSATWWDSKFGHHCGVEPCKHRGTICGAGTTCNDCCAGSADCPWYQFGVCNCN